MNNLNTLRNNLYSVLQKEINGANCCLLDLPNYYNPGDQLIWEGDIELAKLFSSNISYSSSLHFFNPDMIPAEDCILLQGGGGFGDLCYKHQKFREYIVKSFPNNKIIILPSTVHFSKSENIRKSAEIFAQHHNLVICARDEKSFEIVQDNFRNNRCYLLPDAAFAIENIKKVNIANRSGKVLFLLRKDKEKNIFAEKNSLSYIENLEIFDWPTQKMHSLLLHAMFLMINIAVLKLWKILGLHWNSKNDVYGFIKFHSRKKQINTAVDFLSQYDLIITTRLHGHILACLLGIPNIILDNSYGKNRNFYETWMKNNSFNAYYADSPADIRNIIVNNFKNINTNL